MQAKRLLIRWALVAGMLAAVAGCGPGGKRVILLTNGADPFWDAMLAGMQDAEHDFKLEVAGLRTVMDVNDGTPKGQVDRLRQYANQSDIAAVAVSVTDSSNLAIAKAMEACRKAGIQVITIDSDVDTQHQPRRPASPTWAPTTRWAARNWARPPPASARKAASTPRSSASRARPTPSNASTVLPRAPATSSRRSKTSATTWT